jgi:nucleoid-associated protein
MDVKDSKWEIWMALELLHAVIHKLEKETGSPGRIIEAGACLEVSDAPLQELIGQVQQVYSGRTSKSYGQFDPTLRAVSAETHVERLREEGGIDFLEISKRLMEVLKEKAETQNFSTGGHVLMFHTNWMGSRWFGVVILNSTAGTMINENLRVVSAPHLDVEGIRFAGRVNFTEWAAGSERYISFLKGKKNEVSVYFQRFLGCSTTQEDLNDTRNLVKAVKRFAEESNLTNQQRETLLHDVYREAGQKAKDELPLGLEELANRVWPSDPVALRQVLATADPPISDGFVPRKRGLDGLVRFIAKAPKWKLEFDRDVINDQTIEFRKEEGLLIIHNLPDDVAASLESEFARAGQSASEAADVIHVQDNAKVLAT